MCFFSLLVGCYLGFKFRIVFIIDFYLSGFYDRLLVLIEFKFVEI